MPRSQTAIGSGVNPVGTEGHVHSPLDQSWFRGPWYAPQKMSDGGQ